MRPLRALAFAFEKEKKKKTGEETKERNNRGRPRSPAGFNDLSIRIADFSVPANESKSLRNRFFKMGYSRDKRLTRSLAL